MDTNAHECFHGPLNTRKKLNASQTSAIILKNLREEEKSKMGKNWGASVCSAVRHASRKCKQRHAEA